MDPKLIRALAAALLSGEDGMRNAMDAIVHERVRSNATLIIAALMKATGLKTFKINEELIKHLEGGKTSVVFHMHDGELEFEMFEGEAGLKEAKSIVAEKTGQELKDVQSRRDAEPMPEPEPSGAEKLKEIVESNWQQIVALAMFKLGVRNLELTADDYDAVEAEGGGFLLATKGTSMLFRRTTEEENREIAAGTYKIDGTIVDNVSGIKPAVH